LSEKLIIIHHIKFESKTHTKFIIQTLDVDTRRYDIDILDK